VNIEAEWAEAGRDLKSAKRSLQDGDYKWTIIKAYYSMFHAFRSLLFSTGYTEKSHDCLIAAIEELFTDKGLLPPSIITDIRSAKTARESADYGLTYGKASAEGTVRDAEEILRIASSYLAGRGYVTPFP
jgi:uncharacterized protein (UPF0332 family)